MALRSALFALLILPLAPATAHAQEDLPHTATLTVNTRLVVLDVVVTDAKGNPVTNLTRDDFTVYEDLKPQRISSFEPPSAHVLPPAQSASTDLAATFDPAQPTAFGQSPVTILVLDQLNTHFADSSFARRSLHDFLAQQPALLTQPTSLLTVYDNHFKQVHQFTRDRDALLKALAAEPTHNAWQLDSLGSSAYGPIERLDQSLRALEQIAQSGARIPGRKNLIWVGGGFPSLDPQTIDGSEMAEVKSAIQHVTNTLQDTHVTLYAVDPKTLLPTVTEVTDSTQAAALSAIGDAGSLGTDMVDTGDDFDRLAPLTGGRIVRGMNDIAHQIQLAVDLGRSFYTIGYSPTSATDTAAKFRKIRVDCKRPGLTIRTRDGYFPDASREQVSASHETISYDLSTAATSIVTLNGLRITVQPTTSINAPAASFIIHVGSASLTWKPTDDSSSRASVAIMAVFLDKKGAILGHTLHGMIATARPGANLHDPTKTADFAFTVEPIAKISKATTLRFVARDAATGRMGSVDLPVPK